MKKLVDTKRYEKHRQKYIYRRFNLVGKILCTLGLVKIYAEAFYEDDGLHVEETIRFFGYDATVKRIITKEALESSNFITVCGVLLFDTEDIK